jgi:transposase
MTRFVVGDDRSQSTLFPERLEDYLDEDNPVGAIDVFVVEPDLARLGFGGVEPETTGRPAYHPATLLKIYVYGYLNRVQSSRRPCGSASARSAAVMAASARRYRLKLLKPMPVRTECQSTST